MRRGPDGLPGAPLGGRLLAAWARATAPRGAKRVSGAAEDGSAWRGRCWIRALGAPLEAEFDAYVAGVPMSREAGSAVCVPNLDFSPGMIGVR